MIDLIRNLTVLYDSIDYALHLICIIRDITFGSGQGKTTLKHTVLRLQIFI